MLWSPVTAPRTGAGFGTASDCTPAGCAVSVEPKHGRDVVLQLLARVVGVLGVLDELVGELLLGLLRLTAELRHRTAHRLRALAEDLQRWLCCLLRCGGGVLGVLLELRQDLIRVGTLRRLNLRRRDQRYGRDRLPARRCRVGWRSRRAAA